MHGMTTREIARTAACSLLLPVGLMRYLLTGRTGSRTYQALIWMYCATGGWSNAMLSWVISKSKPSRTLASPSGVLGELTIERSQQYTEQLRRDGYVLFERALPEDACDRLLQFATTTPTKTRRMDTDGAEFVAGTQMYSGGPPSAVRYDYNTVDLVNNADIQDLLTDPSLLHLAQRYLRCQPVADVLSMWWHTNYHSAPDSEAAQFYHYDMDRIKWFKVFIYLTDVGPNNGPHSFVAGSHRRGGIPWRLRRKGYVRLTDDEVVECYASQRRLQLSAPRGSIIIEDTRGLHKGNAVVSDPRLILQLQFSNSLFGATYPAAQLSTIHSSKSREYFRQWPRVFRQYVSKDQTHQ